MKARMKVTKEVEIEKIIIAINIRYVGDDEDDDVPRNFPLLNGSLWKATVMVDSGQIEEWPGGEARNLFCKVCDSGAYTLIDGDGEIVVQREGYVPNGIVPGKYGDYVDLKINSDGVIENWPTHPDLSDFFDDGE